MVNDIGKIGLFIGQKAYTINKFKQIINQDFAVVFHLEYTGNNKWILLETLWEVYGDKIAYIERIELTNFDSLLEIFPKGDMGKFIVGAKARNIQQLEQKLNEKNFQVKCVVGINDTKEI